MAHGSEHRELLPLHAKRRRSGRAPTTSRSSGDTVCLIGFFSFDQIDSEEPSLRAAVEQAGDFAWNRLQLEVRSQGPMPVVSEIKALRPAAVIVLLSTTDTAVVKPLFARLRLDNPQRPILVAPRGLSADGILELLSQGATDFLLPPYRADDLLPRLRRMIVPLSSRCSLIARIKAGVGIRSIVGESPAFVAEVNRLPRIAACDVPVLIRGESGTGKDVFARAIHYLGARAGQPFVPVNCGAIPETLMESELFGHQRGAFTGAVKDRIGMVEEADGGTMFLDEVDALPFASQVKLLRFLQDGEFRPLGAFKPSRASVRVIAAANTDFERIIQERKFREDLYYRLNVLRIALPPLRERQGDLPLLANHLLEKQALLLGCHAKPLAASALECMVFYRWPGNVRELENVLTRALVFSEGAEIQAADLSLPIPSKKSGEESFRMMKARVIKDFERDYLQKMLDRHKGNITQAAHAAFKNRRAFWELLRKHGLLLHAPTGAAATESV
ncbi:MAG: sigma-54-dependent Fis family transcriptional regulator [Verrucomicrobia bacterium]|nr:sigma-54-dependent Fis family transcriptional regulator [Verrucomicrobiota bacterium]